MIPMSGAAQSATAAPATATLADALRAGVLVLAALLQIVTAQLPALLGWAETVPTRATALEHPVVPIGYAFAIWGPIFLLGLALAVQQVLPRHRGQQPARRTGWLLAAMFLINAAWQVWVPWRGVDGASLVLLVVEFALGAAVLQRLRGAAHAPWLLVATAGLLTGWLNAAMLVGTGNVALFYGAPYDPRGIVASTALLGVLVVAGAGAAAWLRNPYHTVALVWALHGIVVASFVRQPQPVLAALASVGMAAVVGGYLWGRRRGARRAGA